MLWHTLIEHLEIPENPSREQSTEIETLTLEELFRGKWDNTPPPYKRQRMTSPTPSDPDTVTSVFRDVDQPPQEFRATESFWEDYLKQDDARLLEPADPSRKRKFCD